MANVYDSISVNEHAVAESSLLKATISGHIYSLKAHADMDNGCIVARGNWVSDFADGQVFASKAYVAGTDQPLLVLSVPFGYDARRAAQEERSFYNAKDEIMRAYELCVGDIFTISAKGIEDGSEGSGAEAAAVKPAVGKYVAPDASTGVLTAASSAAASGFSGKIVAVVNYKNTVAYRIFVESV